MLTITAVILAVMASPASAATHTVVKGDHLWGLAGHYYQNHFRWKVIYAANQDKIQDPHWIYPGQVFIIPDVPGPEIGELPARPVEKEVEVAVAPEPEPEPEEEAPAPAPQPAPEPKPEPPPLMTDDLSVKMPDGLAGQYPSMRRVKVEKTWREDGKIIEFDGREAMAGQGDYINATLAAGAALGDKFWVYRPAGPQELDRDPESRYLQRMGLVEVNKALGKNRFRFLIIKSGDSVQVGDLLKRERL